MFFTFSLNGLLWRYFSDNSYSSALFLLMTVWCSKSDAHNYRTSPHQRVYSSLQLSVTVNSTVIYLPCANISLRESLQCGLSVSMGMCIAIYSDCHCHYLLSLLGFYRSPKRMSQFTHPPFGQEHLFCCPFIGPVCFEFQSLPI